MMMIFEIALITAHINRLKMIISRLTRFVNTLTNKFFFIYSIYIYKEDREE